MITKKIAVAHFTTNNPQLLKNHLDNHLKNSANLLTRVLSTDFHVSLKTISNCVGANGITGGLRLPQTVSRERQTR